MSNFVRTIKGINNINKQEKWTNKSGAILVQANKDTYVNADGEYKPITFPIHEAGNSDTTHVADMAVTSDSTKETLQHGDSKQVVTISNNPTVELSDNVKQAWRGALGTVNLDGDQTVDGVKTFKKQIKGKIDNSAHADEAGKVAHTLTVKQDGQDDVVYDGSDDKVVEIQTSGASDLWQDGDLKGIQGTMLSGVVSQVSSSGNHIVGVMSLTIDVTDDIVDPLFKFGSPNIVIGKPISDVPLKMIVNRNGVKTISDGIYNNDTDIVNSIKVFGDFKKGDSIVTVFSTLNKVREN